MNKDAALQALDISKQKWKAGDKAGAVKFAEKSIRLCESNEAEKWLSFISSSTIPESKPQTRQRKAESTPKEEPNRPFTPEQVEGIKKIKAHKAKGDLYGILGLEKGCSDNDIKKAYRKLALKFHPDKCGAPGTDDAFKAIGHAWTVLGDEQKRSSYDRFGIDSESSGNRGGGSGFGGHSGFQGFGGHPGFQGEVTPEELLRMFMGGGAFGGGFGTNGFGLSIFTAEDDPFSFQRSYDYSMEKHSEPHNVPYYVNPKSYRRRFGTSAKQRELNNRVESDVMLR
ncbi:DnaJ, sub C member 18 [Terramyces sp. JEL0728]|nr:DnaJ, sub C member 18 [Terramyces sp. JEL0728]